MNIETGVLKSEELKKQEKEKSEKELVFEKAGEFENKKQVSSAEVSEASEKELFELQQLLDAGVYDEHTAQLIQEVVNSESISGEEIEKIFDIIDSMEDNENINKYLPKEARITKADYQNALTDDSVRKNVLIKLDSALTHISRQIDPNSGSGVNLFSGFLAVLDKNLVSIQEAHIDIKHSIQKIDANNSTENNLSLWQKIAVFIKNLFS